MTFTALHRALGLGPAPLTDELLDEAVANGVTETSDLDWKSALPKAKDLSQSDFPKDVAAMANSGGGVIIFGVRESQKAAVERVNAGEFNEGYERSLLSAAITAISPPVFGLTVHQLGSGDKLAIVVEVPASLDGPHLIYRNHYFGAPMRNGPDTVWMKERQIEAMYRARFNEQRHATEALDNLFSEVAAGRDCSERAWLIAVARPRVPSFRGRLTLDQARVILTNAVKLATSYTRYTKANPYTRLTHPLDAVHHNPRPGLRRWIVTDATAGSFQGTSQFSIHHNGSATLATVVGGLPSGRNDYKGWEIKSSAIEVSIADVMALVRATAEATGNDEYDVRVGIEWTGQQPLKIFTVHNGADYGGFSTPLHRFTPVEVTVNAAESNIDFHWDIHDLAQDCMNQGGISYLLAINPPERS